MKIPQDRADFGQKTKKSKVAGLSPANKDKLYEAKNQGL